MTTSHFTQPMTLKDLIATLKAPSSALWWLQWPPDVFLLTSLVLKKTGWYQLCLENTLHSRIPGFEDTGTFLKLQKYQDAWIKKLTRQHLSTDEQDHFKVMEITLNRLLSSTLILNEKEDPLGSLGGRQVTVEHITHILVWLHAITDELCAGLGLFTSPKTLRKFHKRANGLLVKKGSLSRLPKTHGVVLPKMRTAQKGLTIRNLSLHLSFHQAPVEVQWNSLNLLRRDERQVNFVVFPHPHTVHAADFDEVGSTHKMPSAFGYFDYHPKGSTLEMEEVLKALSCAFHQVKRVHFLILPELSVTLSELRNLQKHLTWHFRGSGHRIPAIVAGVRTPGDPGKNEVYLCHHFYGGRWIEHCQSKHHRWALDPKQIGDYGLTKRFPSKLSTYWEHTHIGPRVLNFLAVNDRFVYCPLICEDLARIEPVSDVVRSVGPNMLIALLMDSAQIKSRWPGRYATVLSEDPGTSVLTVSCKGMVERGANVYYPQGLPAQLEVALWSDAKDCKSININTRDQAVLFTTQLEMVREYTLDGRDDGQQACSLTLEESFSLSCSSDVQLPPSGAPMPDRIDPQELSYLSFLADFLLNASLSEVSEAQQEMQRGPLEQVQSESTAEDFEDAFGRFDDVWQEIWKYQRTENLRRQVDIMLDTVGRMLEEREQFFLAFQFEVSHGRPGFLEAWANPDLDVPRWMSYTDFLLEDLQFHDPDQNRSLVLHVLLWSLHEGFVRVLRPPELGGLSFRDTGMTQERWNSVMEVFDRLNAEFFDRQMDRGRDSSFERDVTRYLSRIESRFEGLS